MVPNTKGAAYRQALANGTLARQAEKVLSAFTGRSIHLSREQLSQTTGVKVSSVCGVVADLLKRGILEVVGTTVSDSGVKVQQLGLA